MFQRFRKRQSHGGQLGVFLSPVGVALARRLDASDEPVIDLMLYRECDGPAAWDAVLSQLVREHKLAGSCTICVLDRASYQLNQMEAPEVPADEVRAAIRWRLKEFLNYRVEDAVVDGFELPQAKARGGPRMMFAVAAPARAVQAVIETVETAGLDLQAIDIPELVLRNLAAEVPDQGGGVAVVSLTESLGVITISQGDQLYLARALEFGSEHLRNNPDGVGDALVLELQRSLDFYESQLAARPASRVLLAPMSADREVLMARMSEQMGAASFALDLGQVVELRGEFDAALQARALYAAGAALRSEAVA